MTYKVSIITNDNVFFYLIDSFLKAQDGSIYTVKISGISEIESNYTQYSDLIIVDGNLTKNSPIELIHDMRFSYDIYTEIWFFSENSIAEYLKKAKEVGVNVILKKPFDPAEIASRITEFLHKHIIINHNI